MNDNIITEEDQMKEDRQQQAVEFERYVKEALAFHRPEFEEKMSMGGVLHSWKRWSEITGIEQGILEVEPDGSIQLFGGDDREYLDCFESCSALEHYFITSSIAAVFERFEQRKQGSSVVEKILNQEGFKP